MLKIVLKPKELGNLPKVTRTVTLKYQDGNDSGLTAPETVKNSTVQFKDALYDATFSKEKIPASIVISVLDESEKCLDSHTFTPCQYIEQVESSQTKSLKKSITMSFQATKIQLSLSLSMKFVEKKKSKPSTNGDDSPKKNPSKMAKSTRKPRERRENLTLDSLSNPNLRSVGSSPNLTIVVDEDHSNRARASSVKESDDSKNPSKAAEQPHSARLVQSPRSGGFRSGTIERKFHTLGSTKTETKEKDLITHQMTSPEMDTSRYGMSSSMKYGTGGKRPRGRPMNKSSGNLDLKQQLTLDKLETDVKYLIDDYIMQENLETYQVGYLVFKCLDHWKTFEEDENDIKLRLILACDKSIRQFNDSRSILFSWISNCICILSLVKSEMKLWTEESPRHIAMLNFLPDVESLFITAYEATLANLEKRLEPIFSEALQETLTTGSNKVASGLDPVFRILGDYMKLMEEHLVMPRLYQQFLERLLHSIAGFLITYGLCVTSSFSRAVNLKLVCTQIEEWYSTKIGPASGDACSRLFEVVKQAANVPCIPKTELIDPATRKEVCNLVRPATISKILSVYQPEMDGDTVEPAILEKLIELDREEDASGKIFGYYSDQDKTQLKFDFEVDISTYLETLPIPVVLQDRFPFLRRDNIVFPMRRNSAADKW